MPNIFGDNLPHSPVQDKLIKKIFSFLDYITLFKMKRVNTTWKSVVNSEIHDRSVVIHVWLPNDLNQSRTGHVSLETFVGGAQDRGIYVSFYPADDVNKFTFFKSSAGTLVESLDKDEKLQHDQPPDHDITLYSLDVERINSEFLKFKASQCNWSIWGSTFFSGKKTRNCSGLIEHLLEISGIYPIIRKNRDLGVNRISRIYSSRATAFVTGALLGAYLNGSQGMFACGLTSFICEFGFEQLSPILAKGIAQKMGTNETHQDRYGETEPDGIASALDGGAMGGTVPLALWGISKGIKWGYQRHGIFGALGGWYLGMLLAGTVGLLFTSPIIIVVGTVTGAIGEGTGVIHTPGGILNLITYTNTAEKCIKKSSLVVRSRSSQEVRIFREDHSFKFGVAAYCCLIALGVTIFTKQMNRGAFKNNSSEYSQISRFRI